MPVQTAPFLAIILSPKRVTLAEAYFVDADLRVTTLGDIEPPRGAFDSNQIASGEVLGRAISDFLSQKQIGVRDAVAVLPEGSAITQLIKLPVMPREDLHGAVRSVAERYAIFAEHAINVDCAVVENFEEDGKQMSNVLIAAARAANVDQCMECARVAGLELLSVEAAPVVATNAYRTRLSRPDVTALAVVGEAKTDVMIFDHGLLKLCYSANIGVSEQGAQGDWMAPPSQPHDPFTPPPQLYSEMNHCFRFFQNQFPRAAVQRVLLVVDHPQAPLLASQLAEQLQLPVELARPAERLELPKEADQQAAVETRSLTLALLRGAALTARRASDLFFPVNLIPPSSTMWRPARPYIKLGIAALVVLLVSASVWTWSLVNKIKETEKRLGVTQAEVARLEPELEALRAAKATELALYSEVERQTARIARERAVHWSQILVDISDRLPRDMWLTRLASPDASKISMTGISTNRETIPNAIESLGGSPYLQNSRLGSLNKDDAYAPGSIVIRYQINATLLRGMQPPPMTAFSTTTAPAGQPQEGVKQ